MVDRAELTTGTAKFRNWHHIGTERLWRPVPNSTEGRAAIRAWLLSPPAEPWACVVGDGQKHIALRTPSNAPAPSTPVVGLVGTVVPVPSDLAALLAAYEGVILAGADDDAIAAWRFEGRSVALIAAVRRAAPLLSPLCGGPVIELLAFLRRPRAILQEELSHG